MEHGADVGFWGRSGNLVLDQSTTGFDPNRSSHQQLSVAKIIPVPLTDPHQVDILQSGGPGWRGTECSSMI
jgi:hypothetical protein